jgi:uncharacterized membrane protein YfcA
VDPVVVVFGFGIGMLVGMTGMGGASLMTPLLILVVGTQPVTAIGTDIFYGAVTKTVGGWRHLKLKTVHRGIAFWLAVGSVPAAIAGVWVIELIQNNYGEDAVNHLVLGMVGAALAVVGVATLLRAWLFADVIPERSAMHLYRRHKVIAVTTGVITGFVIGLTSAGSGTLIAIVLIAVFRLTPQRVVGTDVFHAAVLLWAAGIAHIIGGNVDFGLAGNILVGSIPGVLIGVRLAVKAPQALLRNALGIVLCASALTLLLKQKPPASVLIPSFSVAAVFVLGLVLFQINLHRKAVRRREAAAAKTIEPAPPTQR